jgi:hypothetical protein
MPRAERLMPGTEALLARTEALMATAIVHLPMAGAGLGRPPDGRR